MSVRDVVQAAAGALGGAATYVEDVFSTYLYTGNGSTQTITNGTDLDGEGGMVWIKSRSAATDNQLFDTERGVTKELIPNSVAAETTDTDTLTAFNADGFSLGADSDVNTNAATYASWTFRKAPKFFDVVTYTGTGSAQNIPHNLGSVPGCVIVKATTSGKDWYVYHRGTDATSPEDYYTFLNKTQGRTLNTTIWDTAPTDTHLVLGSHAGVNSATDTYVAYLFAHNDGDGEFGEDADQDIIKCGSYAGTSVVGNFVSLGFEPQWILIKRADTVADWFLLDSMRGLATGIGGDAYLKSSKNEAEGSTTYVAANPTGFTLETTNTGFNASGSTYIYIAIRRGPMKTPESGTDFLYMQQNKLATSPGFQSDTNAPIDLALHYRVALGYKQLSARLMGEYFLYTGVTNVRAADSSWDWDYLDGYYAGGASTDYKISYMMRRFSQVMETVMYTGNGTAGRTVTHNLSVAPEMMIVKATTYSENFHVYHSGLGNTKRIWLDSTNAAAVENIWNNTTPTDSQFTLSSNAGVNRSGETYLAILFATYPGISKVGSYTGTAADLNVDCGFSAGARFILIKRTDSTGDWYVWDSVRGITAGNDPYILLNSSAAEVTNTDYIDPLSSGFTVTSSAPAALNASGGSYIFLAIA